MHTDLIVARGAGSGNGRLGISKSSDARPVPSPSYADASMLSKVYEDGECGDKSLGRVCRSRYSSYVILSRDNLDGKIMLGSPLIGFRFYTMLMIT